MRHGRSKANEAKLIVSRLENGIQPEYGLSPTGIEQATAAG
jgi:broad specificity phosphatase PhoE